MHGEAVLETMRATGVLGDVAADGACALARRIRRVVIAEGRHCVCHLEIRHAWFDGDAEVRNVDVEDAIEVRQLDHDSFWRRQRAAGEAGAVATCDERYRMAMAEPDDRS